MDYTYTDMTRENSIRYKEPFSEIDKIRHKNKKRISQIYLLKLAFEELKEKQVEEPDLTYWQNLGYIVGPASTDQFHGIGLHEKRKAMEDFIISHSDTTTKVLDAGCNTGVEGYRLYSRGFQGSYVGVDNNLKALVYALDNLEGTPASFCLTEITEINYPDNYFDIVFTDTLEGLSYYESTLKELARLTSRWLIISSYIQMTDEPDLIKKQDLVDGNANRYNRKKMYDFLNNLCLKNPNVIYRENDPEFGIQEVITFEKITPIK